MNPDEIQIAAAVDAILASPKYRRTGVCRATVADVVTRAWQRYRQPAKAIAAARATLHQVVASYLGDPDYLQASERFQAARNDPPAVRHLCRELLAVHASTRERLPHLEEFHARLWATIGPPQVVLDLACGLHPLAWPWMGLPEGAHYHAFDCHTGRVALLQTAFQVLQASASATVSDVLTDPPQEPADVALLLKEAHRLEERQSGATRSLAERLRVRHLVISLPARSLDGRRDLEDRHRRLCDHLAGAWPRQEWRIGDELVWCCRLRP